MLTPIDDGEDKLWTVQDVARYAQVSRSWVYQRAAEGTIPCLKVAGLLRFDPVTIKTFLRTGGVAERKVIPLFTKNSDAGK